MENQENDSSVFFTQNLEYCPEKFVNYLKSELDQTSHSLEAQKQNFATLNLVKNELIGQSDRFKQKLVTKCGILPILAKFIAQATE